MKAFDKFFDFVAAKRIFFIWFLSCFSLDRITTYIVLTQGWFGESNPTALLMWNAFGFVLSELMSIIIVMIVFFYVGVWGSKSLKKYV